MSNNKFESLLELLINEENDKAEALFHEIVVEKSRDIYESLADSEIEEAKEETKEESKEEVKLEIVLPSFLKNKIITAMIKAHPYEEVAYDLIPLENNSNIGAGIVGDLKNPVNEEEFLKEIKKIFRVKSLRYTKLLNKPIKRVAICGGSGSFLLENAINLGADIFITSDFKYHQFFDADGKIIIADLGHYESEQYTIELIADLLIKNFTNFAIRLTSVNTNPINYL